MYLLNYRNISDKGNKVLFFTQSLYFLLEFLIKKKKLKKKEFLEIHNIEVYLKKYITKIIKLL